MTDFTPHQIAVLQALYIKTEEEGVDFCDFLEEIRNALAASTVPVAEDDAQPVAIYQGRMVGFKHWHDQSEAGYLHMVERPSIFEARIVYATRDAAPTDAPSFEAKHVSLKQKGDKIILTLELDGVEGSPRYTVTPINPGVVRIAASAQRNK